MMQDTIRDIRKKCRLKMNGAASTSMREKGLHYKLNFGLMIPQIKSLAAEYKQNKELAEMLWSDDTRELKILATLLYPPLECSESNAKRWASDVLNQEVREQLCMNLLQEVEFANRLAIELSNDHDLNIRTTGYWLMVRLFVSKKIETIRKLENFAHIWGDVACENLFARNAALSSLKHLGCQSDQMAQDILNRIDSFETNDNPIMQEVYNSLSFEFDYNQK